MDHRCPACSANLKQRKVAGAVIAKMEIDCPACGSRIRLNLHGTEVLAWVVHFAALGVAIVGGYLFQNKEVMVGGIVAAAIAALATRVLDRTYLRAWPRYTRARPVSPESAS